MFIEAYKRAFDVLKRKPFRLWGLSLLSVLICVLAVLLCLFFIPLGIAFAFVVSCGMAKVYLDGLEYREVNADQLFAGFKSFIRIAGGMAWRFLWVLIWCLIPIAGPFIAIYKYYQYAFVPYILMTRPDVNATAALRLSKELTNGKKGHMFLADLVFGVAVWIVGMVFGGLGMIPFIGQLFALLYALLSLVIAAFSPIFEGLYRASFYLMPQPVQNSADSTAQNNDTQSNV